MLPRALAVGSTADRAGPQADPVGGVTVLPVRAVPCTLSNDAEWLIAVQLLDSVGPASSARSRRWSLRT